ncbi:ABC transporter permease [Paenibacillus sp. GSMTC-2017]|uniref:ABC transporter permease n=1 Tax=Paenibacillus sp. GSMTC-2017 TaxID=2794350 RepID=UPI0018D7BF36|nr:ABC transporter permease [Paenibacillus sp. GSMTC-2017]MBH5319517.1 ABC transporter permease [Paenibacillus sp. GSMTC-2017]
MLNLIGADLYKLRKSVAIKVLFAITTLSAFITAIIAYLIPLNKIEAGITGLGFMFSDVHVISIIGAFLAAVYICGDFENKTIHDTISNGNSRTSIIISKATVFFIAIVFVLLPYAIITGISLSTDSAFSMGSLAVGFLHLLTTEHGAAFSASEIMKLLSIMFTLMIVYIAQLSLCVPLAIALKKPILVIAIFYGFSIISAQSKGLGESYPLFDRIFSFTPYGGHYAFLTLDTRIGDIMKAVGMSLLFIIFMLVIAYSLFRKSEIK